MRLQEEKWQSPDQVFLGCSQCLAQRKGSLDATFRDLRNSEAECSFWQRMALPVLPGLAREQGDRMPSSHFHMFTARFLQIRFT